jgi:hypothetical protein
MRQWKTNGWLDEKSIKLPQMLREKFIGIKCKVNAIQDIGLIALRDN